ncbi:MAG: DUF2304 family protein [Actinobacteria bacterium]|uniref:Unannotated protein n=1 Tax=freshwater metagenome TaxID=449393 RepID=A0A6J6X3J3_9ZZZZ|nr:DUF2304 family protein [Actinomycetota bacterium]MSW06246.1 DUF2304 family protein [Actinomycetota bacterium]MSY07201.1 DUF2304 family protein [Actinomycetota bacterium]MSZ29972.1 DUF2304 family protein [Actinomycetota bacterium]
MKQELVIALGGVGLAVFVLLIARKHLLTLRYTVGWVVLAVVMTLSALLAGFVEPLANAVGMTATGVLLALASGTLLLICIQLSISVSGLSSQLRELIEANALLAARVEELAIGEAPSQESNG